MSQPPTVSVVIPTYNRADLIGRAIRSVLAQTWTDWELVVVDDCSQDATADVVRSFADPRIRLIRHERNRGESGGRNTGIAEARGPYVAFLDSDDEWLPAKLEKQLAALRAQNGDVCYCQAYSEVRRGEFEVQPREPYRSGSLLRHLVCEADAAMQPSSLVFKREWGTLGFDETMPIHPDWDWLLRVRERTDRFVFVPEPLYYFHCDAPLRASDGKTIPMIQKAEPFLAKQAAALAADPAVRRVLYWAYAYDAQRRGQTALARQILRRGRVYPSLWRWPHGFKLWLDCLRG